ncbi:MAG: phage major capsid protein [Anaerovoracaceae bacterium]
MNELLRRQKEIKARLIEIRTAIESPEADLDALETESRNLTTEFAQNATRIEEAERRNQILEDVVEHGVETRRLATPAATEEVEERDVRGSKEYRSAYLNSLRGRELSEIEERAMTTASASAGAAIPTITLNQIMTKVTQFAPLLDKIELVKVPGKVKLPAEGTTNEASLHTEGEKIEASDDVLNYVELGMYEVTKLITISKSVEKMSIDAFETWLCDKIARNIADRITKYILLGTGKNQPEGINSITWGVTNSITIAKAASPVEKDIDDAVALLNGGYDNGASWIMSKNTFFKDFRNIQNKAKNDVVAREGNVWYLNGYPVEFDDRFPEHEAILGNLKLGYMGNMPEEVTITSEFVVRENSYDFFGCAMFDGKVQATEAFVKIVKATA